MGKYANVSFINQRTIQNITGTAPAIYKSERLANTPEGVYRGSGYSKYADVYINLTDENGKPVAGNYAYVSYREYFNGVATDIQYINIIGFNVLIGTQMLIENTDPNNSYIYNLGINGGVVENDGSYTPQDRNDAAISTVKIDQKESSPGSHNGQITIMASSSAGYIQYSLDGVNYQPSATFTGLAGGGYTAYIKDAQEHTTSLPFTLETIASLLIADPAVPLGSGNTSRWSAAFNPVVFTYQRRDFSIINISSTSFGLATSFVVDGSLSTYYGSSTVKVEIKDLVYINAGAYNGVYEVTAVDFINSTITINEPYVSAATHTGFININKLRPYYQVKSKITYQDKLSGKTETITCTHRPNQSGLVKADLSSFLQTLLRATDESNFTQVNYRDDNLSASYTLSYAEVWQDTATGIDIPEVYISTGNPYYVLYAARQLGDVYGGNMAAYVPFKTVDGPSRRAQWVTDFAEPAYSQGYPFDIGFIYSEDLAGLNLYCEITPLDINRQPMANGTQTTYLLNEDSSFLLNQDGSKLIIKQQVVNDKPVTQGIAQQIGLNRLRINTDFSSQVCYFNIALKYADAGNTIHTVTQTQTIRVDDAIDDQSVYLRWIGLTGSWNYYRFVYNQEVTLDVQNAVIVKNHVLDWASQDAMEDVISKSAGLKMKVMAEDLSVADIKGLQSIKYSPKVQMLVSKNPIKWQTVVLNTATFAEYETRNGQAPFSVTFNLPGLNVQTQ